MIQIRRSAVGLGKLRFACQISEIEIAVSRIGLPAYIAGNPDGDDRGKTGSVIESDSPPRMQIAAGLLDAGCIRNQDAGGTAVFLFQGRDCGSLREGVINFCDGNFFFRFIGGWGSAFRWSSIRLEICFIGVILHSDVKRAGSWV